MIYKTSNEFFESVAGMTPDQVSVRINESVQRGYFANAQVIQDVMVSCYWLLRCNLQKC